MHLNMLSLQMTLMQRVAPEPTTSEITSDLVEPAAPVRSAAEQGPTEPAADKPDLEASVFFTLFLLCTYTSLPLDGMA